MAGDVLVSWHQTIWDLSLSTDSGDFQMKDSCFKWWRERPRTDLRPLHFEMMLFPPFSSVVEQTGDIANHFFTRREHFGCPEQRHIIWLCFDQMCAQATRLVKLRISGQCFHICCPGWERPVGRTVFTSTHDFCVSRLKYDGLPYNFWVILQGRFFFLNSLFLLILLIYLIQTVLYLNIY